MPRGGRRLGAGRPKGVKNAPAVGVSRHNAGEAFVYVITAEGSKLVKIGKANDVQRRVSSLQVAAPVMLCVAACFRCASESIAIEVEGRAHTALAHKRVRGEWFLVAPEVVVKTIEEGAALSKWQVERVVFVDTRFERERRGGRRQGAGHPGKGALRSTDKEKNTKENQTTAVLCDA